VNEDTITITPDDLIAITDDDNMTLSGWNSPLKTSLSGTNSITGTLGTAVTGVTTVTGGGSGATLTTTSGGSLMWGNPNHTVTATPYTISNATTGWATYNNQPSIMKVDCDAVFNGDIKIRGVSLDERLNVIEERLGILRPNNDLEGRWEKLKALGEEYRRLEKEILEGEDIWATLKK
jgi:hypothetical protein